MYTTLKDKIRMGIYSKNFIKDLIFLNSVDSTNSYGLSLEAKEEGIVILTKEQLDGRGRNKRPWHSVKDKSIMMSIIINYPEKSDSTSFIPLLSANAIIETLDSFGLSSKIKWPNDVLVNSKKISGILCESSFVKDRSNFIVVGIGINVNLSSEDFVQENIDYVIKPTSLKIETGSHFNLEDVLFDLLNNFSKWILEYKKNNYHAILEFWKNNWSDIGKTINVVSQNKLITGIAQDISSRGELVLQTDNGLELINSGEIKT